ncbi:MAG: bacteriohemerythrin [Treponema sp.]|jgi:hemerythrin|nr:bacteriohemerythrin [Treponema sp.]
MEKSELVKWSSALSVGVKVLDDQHQELIRLTNDLFNHCVGDAESEKLYLSKVIQGTRNYIKVHFSTEEELLIRTKFPDYREHKREHDAFVLTVVEQVRNIKDQKFSLIVFTRYLKDWILTHIAVSDKKYAGYFKSISQYAGITGSVPVDP